MGSASQNRFATLLICATKADQNLWKITGVSLFTAEGPHPRGYSRLRFARRLLATTAFFQCDSAAHFVGYSRLRVAHAVRSLLYGLALARVHRFREDLALVDAVERLPQLGTRACAHDVAADVLQETELLGARIERHEVNLPSPVALIEDIARDS